jgi:hypothetical protein
VFLVNGKPLNLGTTAGRDADSAGLRHSPYEIPTSWIAMFYYRVEHDVIAQLGEAATSASRRSRTPRQARSDQLQHRHRQDPRLKAFAAR